MTDGMHEDVGFLTWFEWRQLNDALDKGPALVGYLRTLGPVKGARVEGQVSRGAETPIPMPPTALSADAISRLLYELNRYPSDEAAANHSAGAEMCRALVKEVRSALHRWPPVELPHRVPLVACRSCGRRTIEYHPPLEVHDLARMVCSACGVEADYDQVRELVEGTAAAVLAERVRARRARDRENQRRRDEEMEEAV